MKYLYIYKMKFLWIVAKMRYYKMIKKNRRNTGIGGIGSKLNDFFIEKRGG